MADEVLPPDLQASVDAAIESLKQEELTFARTFAKIWDEGYQAGLDFGHQYAQDTYDGPSENPVTNPYLPAVEALEAELGEAANEAD